MSNNSQHMLSPLLYVREPYDQWHPYILTQQNNIFLLFHSYAQDIL